MTKQRKDKRGRILRTGEDQLPDGRYRYRYIDAYGSQKAVYSWRLILADKFPEGKRRTPCLREMEERIDADLHARIDAGASASITLNEMYQRYMDTKTELRRSSRLHYEYIYRTLVSNGLGKRKLRDVHYSDIKKLYSWMRNEKGYQPRTVETLHNILHPIFEMAVRDDILRKNPTTGVLSEMRQSPNWITERIEFEGDQYCNDCLNAVTVICSCCGERIRRDESYGNDGTPLCENCYERNYTTCNRCGRLLRYDDACYDSDDPDEEYPYCSTCYRERHQDGIQDYYYKPDPIFYGNGPRFFGVELEIDGAGEYNKNAKRILDAVNTGDEYIYCKHDGSLDEGFEIVTHPMALKFHMDSMHWDTVTEEARAMGYTSHQAGTCGLHVHVSREAFGHNEAAQDAAIARVLYFFEKHWEELLKFSRRTQRQLDHWASRYGFKNQPMDILDHAKHGTHAGRYTAVNLTNTNTVEFRMFRGTLKLNTILATLQLIDRICDVALFMSDDELKAMSWTSFVSGCTQPELIQYLKERRLYINEPVESEVEL